MCLICTECASIGMMVTLTGWALYKYKISTVVKRVLSGVIKSKKTIEV
jgi:hypothetical protein